MSLIVFSSIYDLIFVTMLPLKFLLLIVVVLSVSAQASLVFWTGRGASPNLWTDPLNWSSKQIPQSTDSVVIASNEALEIEIPRDTSVEVQKLWVGSDASPHRIRLKSFAPINVLEHMHILSSGEVNVYSADFLGGSAAVSGKLFLCNALHNRINLTNIEAEKHGGIFEIMYLPSKSPSMAEISNAEQFCQRVSAQAIKNHDSQTIQDEPILLDPVLVDSTANVEAVQLDPVFGAPLATNMFSITVPGTRGNKPLTTEEHLGIVHDITHQIAIKFGGATIVPSEGAWVSTIPDQHGNPTLIRERVTSINVAANLDADAKLFIKNVATGLLENLEQEAIFVTLGSRSFLVTHGHMPTQSTG